MDILSEEVLERMSSISILIWLSSDIETEAAAPNLFVTRVTLLDLYCSILKHDFLRFFKILGLFKHGLKAVYES